MRWENLFDDLESQLAQELTAEEIDLQAEEERLRLARLGIRDRLHALHTLATHESERMLRLHLRDGSRVTAVSSTFGRDWFAGELVEESGRRPGCIIPFEAIDAVSLTREQVLISLDGGRQEESPAALSAKLGLSFVLRDLCRRRQGVELILSRARLYGTIDRVGRDHLDLAVHDAGIPRRDTSVTDYRMVRFGQLLCVRLP
jgi:hypothetical protein